MRPVRRTGESAMAGTPDATKMTVPDHFAGIPADIPCQAGSKPGSIFCRGEYLNGFGLRNFSGLNSRDLINQ